MKQGAIIFDPKRYGAGIFGDAVGVVDLILEVEELCTEAGVEAA